MARPKSTSASHWSAWLVIGSALVGFVGATFDVSIESAGPPLTPMSAPPIRRPVNHEFVITGVQHGFNMTERALEDIKQVLKAVNNNNSIEISDFSPDRNTMSWFDPALGQQEPNVCDKQLLKDILDRFKRQWDLRDHSLSRSMKLFLGPDWFIGGVKIHYLGPCRPNITNYQGMKRTLGDDGTPATDDAELWVPDEFLVRDSSDKELQDRDKYQLVNTTIATTGASLMDNQTGDPNQEPLLQQVIISTTTAASPSSSSISTTTSIVEAPSSGRAAVSPSDGSTTSEIYMTTTVLSNLMETTTTSPTTAIVDSDTSTTESLFPPLGGLDELERWTSPGNTTNDTLGIFGPLEPFGTFGTSISTSQATVVPNDTLSIGGVTSQATDEPTLTSTSTSTSANASTSSIPATATTDWTKLGAFDILPETADNQAAPKPTTTEAPLTTTEAPLTTTEAPLTTTEAPLTTTEAAIKTTTNEFAIVSTQISSDGQAGPLSKPDQQTAPDSRVTPIALTVSASIAVALASVVGVQIWRRKRGNYRVAA